MKLYVCWGTFQLPKPGGHACANAYEAVRDAGYSPDVVHTFGWGILPDLLNGPRRAEVKKLSGDTWVPLLVLDDGTLVKGTKKIIAWAAANPAATPAAA